MSAALVADQTGMKGIIVAIVASALCTAGVCFLAFSSSPARTATIDGSTDETFKASIDTVKQALPQPRQEEFAQAMTTLAGAVMLPPSGNPLASIMALSADPGAAGRKLRTRVHGMTASDVIAAGATAAAEVNERGAQLDGLVAMASGGLPEARINANESAAIATLRSIASAQAKCQASGVIDANGNAAGEYGFFAELAGSTPVRGGARISSPVLPSAFGNVTDSRIMRSGYCFQMFLPDAKGTGVLEAPAGGSGGVSVDAGQAEVLWCCYAWPTTYSKSGGRAFFVNQSGDVLASRNTNQRYSGFEKMPPFTAALQCGSTSIGDMVAVDTEGNDGEIWLVVNEAPVGVPTAAKPAQPGEFLVPVTLTNKEYHASDPINRRTFEDVVFWDAHYDFSKLTKPARAIKGLLEFTDLFGELKFMLKTTINEPVAEGGEHRSKGTGFRYNQFRASDQWVRATDVKDMRVVFRVQQIIYADGGQAEFR